MIELHFVPTPNGHKISIMLEEVGLPYELRPYNLPEGEHLKPAFRQINPNARLPAMVDHAPADGGAPFAVFETGAMLQYLAEKSGQLIPADLRGRSLCLQWLSWQIAGFGPFQGQAHHFIRYAPLGQDYGIERYRRETERALHVLNRRLGEVEYLAGVYSIADIATWPWVRATRAIAMPLDPFPHIQRWFAAIGERPGVVRGTSVTNSSNLSSLRPTLSDEQWSNLFGENMLASAVADGWAPRGVGARRRVGYPRGDDRPSPDAMVNEASAASDLMVRVFQRLVWLDDGLQARLHARGWPDVSRSQSMVMINVTSGIRRPADIARQVGVSRQAVHVTINQMTALGIVRLADDPDDKRYKVVELTPFGERMRHDAQDALAEMTRTLVERIGTARLTALLDVLRIDWGASS